MKFPALRKIAKSSESAGNEGKVVISAMEFLDFQEISRTLSAIREISRIAEAVPRIPTLACISTPRPYYVFCKEIL